MLVALSEELGGFIEYVGGSEWGHVLLSPLENLAAIEEPVVLDKVATRNFLYWTPWYISLTDESGRRVPKQDLRPALFSAG